jgi:acyl-coenzyme A synthetase/AMP-(fatty) acid ligase
MMMHELLEHSASRVPDKTFLFSESQSVTYSQALDSVRKAAAALQKLGVKKGDRVLIFAPNSVEYVLAMFSVFKLGAIAALIDILDPSSYRRNVKNLAPKLVIAPSEHIDALKKSTPNAEFVSFDNKKETEHSWQSLLNSLGEEMQVDFTEDTPCHLSFTSGTTYEPKPAVLSHEPSLRATRCIAERLELTTDDTTLGVTTLSSSHILVYGILPQMHRRASIGIMERWNPSNAWKMIHNHQVRMISGTAIRLSELIGYARDQSIDKGSLMLVLSGGSAGIGRIRKKWEQHGVPFVETYGMSELGGSVAMGHRRFFKSKPVKPFNRIPCIGPALPDKEVKIVDENGKEVSCGVPGEILVSGGFMWGYWGLPEETTKTTRGGWLHTSDIGLMDEFDNVYWLARKTDIIHTENGPIYPRVIEETLFDQPSVRQACAVGVQHGKNQVPVAFVAIFPNESVREEQLLNHCKSTLERTHYQPSRVVIKTELPMTPSGKIDKKQLKRSEELVYDQSLDSA